MTGAIGARALGPETIFALSSGQPPAAIAILRVSGPRARDVLRQLAGSVPTPRRASLRALRNPADGTLLDSALVLWLPGPTTATGEDSAELHLHGGRAVIDAVSCAIAKLPCTREAQPGEFTRRAFLNGRIDLAAAEGLADLLAAETDAERRAALDAAGGALGREIEGWRGRLLSMSAVVEAALDFAEEDDVSADAPGVRAAAALLAGDLAAALVRPPAERLRDGLRVVIAGPPNAGKSTLLNALAGRDAAIVSGVPGTTRDRIEVPIGIDGTPLLLIDTAGLRNATDEIEATGIARANRAIDEADILLWLGDDLPPGCSGVTICVHARADLPERAFVPAAADVAISATDRPSIDRLLARIVATARTMLPRAGEATVNRRQRSLLDEAHAALVRAGQTPDLLLVAEELRAALRQLDAIVGRSGVEDMLDTLFAGFCIGK